jgi:radical SAM/Cys-rich protein
MLIAANNITPFEQQCEDHNVLLKRKPISTLQVNIGKRCNQACHHCHVESGPERTENMTLPTIERLLLLIKNTPSINTVDITGGAPELNPHFRYFVKQIRKRNIAVIDRCNLTVLSEPGQEDTAQFLADQQVHIVASLPCYLEDNVNKQRGKGVFDKSIKALQQLNQLGYASDSQLTLNLVYNPVGIHLPPAQMQLEADYKAHLKQQFNIEFNHLFTITNMPIKRFAHQLQREEKLDEYMQLLIENFNPQAANNVMCKDLLSISWNGEIYDCDFNQMLEMPIKSALSIFDIESFTKIENTILTDNHCFGCTAGSGSSCGGALTE